MEAAINKMKDKFIDAAWPCPFEMVTGSFYLKDDKGKIHGQWVDGVKEPMRGIMITPK